jgi:superfamily II DNA or RNA helicase
MNQWIERIKMALPLAKVGIIQADKFNVKGNDIVIGMLQTLSMKEFDNNAFDDFGHVIIDECHTISSRIFSKALFKVNAKYMLGISATPNRSDGLMKVLNYQMS